MRKTKLLPTSQKWAFKHMILSIRIHNQIEKHIKCDILISNFHTLHYERGLSRPKVKDIIQ